MIWDDHDYGKNNGGADYKYKFISKEIFKKFSLNENSDITESGPGTSFKLKFSNISFFFLDNRFFRDKKYHFGKKQEQWLFDNINENSVLISGDQFFGGYHPFESFESNHAQNFRNFIKKISQLNSPPLFISGDRHLSEVQHLTFQKPLREKKETFEITSSPMHSSPSLASSLKSFPNPRRIWAVAAKNNFCIVSFKNKVNEFSLAFYDENGDLL